MKALLVDLDGVLYVGERPVEGAAEALAWLEREGVPHLFVTNTTSRPRSALVEKLERLGLPRVAPERILTPPVAARRWLSENAPGPAALFVPEATAGELGELPRLEPGAERGAASVVLGDLGEARRAGLAGLLVRTGKFRPEDLDREDVAPDAVLDSVAELPAWWAAAAQKE